MEADIPSEQFEQIRRLVFEQADARSRFARWLVTVQQQNHPAAVALVRANLSLCFPQLTADQIESLVERNLQHYFEAKLENAGFADASDEEVRQRVQLDRLELLMSRQGQAVVIVCPHFINFGPVCHRLALETSVVALYAGEAMGQTLRATARFNKDRKSVV